MGLLDFLSGLSYLNFLITKEFDLQELRIDQNGGEIENVLIYLYVLCFGYGQKYTQWEISSLTIAC